MIAPCKLVQLYNILKFTLIVDRAIVEDPERSATITFVHKSKFKNKLRRVSFTDYGTVPVIDGVPGKLNKRVGETYVSYYIEVPGSIQDQSWLGHWDVYFSLGDYGDPVYTTQLKGYFLFKEPLVNQEYKDTFHCYITKVNDIIFVGQIFVLDESLIEGIDRLDSGETDSTKEVIYSDIVASLVYKDIPAEGGSTNPELTYTQTKTVNIYVRGELVDSQVTEINSGAGVVYIPNNPVITKNTPNEIPNRLLVATVVAYLTLNGKYAELTTDVYQEG